ncbi:hypothetical protein C2S51_033245 [Perilla frutescens var. frutescens]|nr:hypothetical protein C2S51_033245 [Perilla frutescens var. frutescens]
MAVASLANLLGLSLLLCSSIAVYGARQPPAESPHPPPPPPSHPPLPPPRKKVVVQGIVQCFYCVIERGSSSVTKGALLPGAVVKLQCNNTKQGWEQEATTDNNGSFTFRPEKVTTWGAHKCRVALVSSPRADCSVNDNYYFMDSGRAFLKPIPTNMTSPFQLFTVGPFWFDPTTYMCL